ncbi:MAG: SCO family protein [Flavobacteriales bacterium]|nr:SCO family protein [Flavobacteriales bacterium]|tara:strand:- start:3081 stop:3764 length:684 start_codon:yes stop_codon:yes gene_type:complete
MQNSKNSTIITILFLLLIFPSLVYFYVTRGYNNFINLEIVGGESHKIDNFSLVNQYNQIVNNDSLRGSIYVANFFFTNCPNICPVMTKNMSYLQSNLKVYPNIKFVSYTVDPVNDTPERFLEYIEEMRRKNVNIDLKNWDFLTGEKDDIYKLAMSYFANAKEDSIAPGGFLHSEYFILIDKEGQIRSGKDKFDNTIGAYDGTNEIHMKNLIDDVKVLMAEYKKPKKD